MPRDPRQVVLGEGYEIAYWSQKFGVSPEKLAEAVKTVGRFSTAVEEYLKNPGPGRETKRARSPQTEDGTKARP